MLLPIQAFLPRETVKITFAIILPTVKIPRDESFTISILNSFLLLWINKGEIFGISLVALLLHVTEVESAGLQFWEDILMYYSMHDRYYVKVVSSCNSQLSGEH